LSHFPRPPSNMASQTSNPLPLAACSVEYRDEFQCILILIYKKLITIIKIVYCQFNA